MAASTEPRTRTAAEVADHASDLHSAIAEASTDPTADVRSLCWLLERLVAQVEDLAAEVTRLQGHDQ